MSPLRRQHQRVNALLHLPCVAAVNLFLGVLVIIAGLEKPLDATRRHPNDLAALLSAAGGRRSAMSGKTSSAEVTD